jgi:hypothetical protein
VVDDANDLFLPTRVSVDLQKLVALKASGPVQDGLGRVARSRDDGPSLTPHFPASGFGRGIQCIIGLIINFGTVGSEGEDCAS